MQRSDQKGGQFAMIARYIKLTMLEFKGLLTNMNMNMNMINKKTISLMIFVVCSRSISRASQSIRHSNFYHL